MDRSKLPVCIIGDSTQEVAAAAAAVLSYLGYRVRLLSFLDSAEAYIAQFKYDEPLYHAWQQGIANKSLSYVQIEQGDAAAVASDIDSNATFWLFLDGLKPDFVDGMFKTFKHAENAFIFSGVLDICQIDKLAGKLSSQYVFYVPFIFLTYQSVFASTLGPKLLLVGEKVADSTQDVEIFQQLRQRAGAFKVTDIKTAEFARGCMMNLIATRLSFINEMSRLASACSVDMNDVEDVLKLDERVGSGFLHASWGFGGHTLPQEVTLLKKSFAQKGVSTSLIDAVVDINDDQKELIFRKFWRYFDTRIDGKAVLIWGVSYKSGAVGTEDSAIHPLLTLLWAHNITTYVYDDKAGPSLSDEYESDERLKLVSSAYEALVQVDALFILSWPDAQRPDVQPIATHKIPVFDAQNLLNKEEIGRLEFYTGMGRGYYI